ncbi:SH3 domain-containing protein [Lentibacter algarum]|uniref:SH3 domain-containing protein n=1 Tax=Lentibacter algarum TaxID=576131 RepID=UPI001C0726FE|nr:SH3 domain-containing protein [Lentibacter algarum]MBU2981486.1 SH3 domain-containing protein [Lentibacter algarum]
MFRSFFTALMFVGLAAVAQAEKLRVYSPGDGFLNLRTGPGSEFSIVRRMGHGTTVDTLERSGNWLRVRHQSGADGWAYIKHFRKVVASTNKRTVSSPGDGYLNLRTGPGTSFAIVREMYNGQTVRILERKGSWARVRHQSGATGWASAKYLQ